MRVRLLGPLIVGVNLLVFLTSGLLDGEHVGVGSLALEP